MFTRFEPSNLVLIHKICQVLQSPQCHSFEFEHLQTVAHPGEAHLYRKKKKQYRLTVAQSVKAFSPTYYTLINATESSEQYRRNPKDFRRIFILEFES